MALLNPYCTVAQVQGEIRNTDSVNTTQLEAAINAASRFIDNFKRRDYFYHNHASSPLKVWKSMDCVFKDELFLPYWPIITLTQVSVGGTVLVEDTDFIRVTSKPWVLKAISGSWSTSDDPDDVLALTGTFGYLQSASTDVPSGLPPEISQACVLIAAALCGHNMKEVIGLDGNPQTIATKDIPKSAYDLLGGRGLLL